MASVRHSLTIPSKEFKDYLKTFSAFVAQSMRKTQTHITITHNPELCMIVNTDHATVFVPLKEEYYKGPGNTRYTFAAETLETLASSSGKITMEWDADNPNSQLYVTSDKVKAALKVAVPEPEYNQFDVNGYVVNQIPLEVMHYIAKYTKVPFSYHKGRPEISPIKIYTDPQNMICAMADDDFSVACIKTPFRSDNQFDITLPRYVLSALYSEETPKMGKLASHGYQVALVTDKVQVYLSGMNEEVQDFERIHADYHNKWISSCVFESKELLKAIRPLTSIIPSKDRAGTTLNIELTEKMKMYLQHRDIGEAVVDQVGGITDIYNENSQKVVVIRVHPEAFQDYTSLFDIPTGRMYLNPNVVYYDGKLTAPTGDYRIQYMFPTVQG